MCVCVYVVYVGVCVCVVCWLWVCWCVCICAKARAVVDRGLVGRGDFLDYFSLSEKFRKVNKKENPPGPPTMFRPWWAGGFSAQYQLEGVFHAVLSRGSPYGCKGPLTAVGCARSNKQRRPTPGRGQQIF